MSQYGGGMFAGADKLEVDVQHLEQIKTYLETVAKTIEDKLLNLQLEDVHRTFEYGGKGRSALGDPAIPNLQTLIERHEGSYQAVKLSLQNMVKAYRDMGKTVGEFAAKYKTVEERNHAGMLALQKRV